MKTIVKRNGEIEEFNFSKIEKAVRAAFDSAKSKIVDEETIQICLNVIKDTIKVKDASTVEDIQNIVEDSLMCCGHYSTARAYILYREKHNESRFIQSRLDYMDKYSSANTNAATASETDSNANVAMKNVANMEGEVYKVQNRLVQRTRMKKRLKELFPEVADQYEVDLNNHIIYAHDEASSPAVKNYTYSPDEVVNFKYNDVECLGSLKTLYDLAIETEVQQEENSVWCKFPQSLYVKDKDEKYTKVTRLTRKTRYNDMVRVKTAFGEDLIVTANHPLIVSDDKEDKVNAENAIGLSQLRLPCTLKFKGTKVIDLASCVDYDEVRDSYILTHETQAPYYFTKRYIELDRTLGYVIGFFIGDGNYDNTYNTLMFSQKDRKVLEKLADSLFKSFGTVSYIHQNNNGVCVLKLCSNIVYDLFRNYFKIKDKAYNKCIPYNVLEFTEDFAKGIIEGIIDSDGTVDTDSAINIRLSSRECIMQLSMLLRYFGYGVSNTHQATPFGNNKAIKTNYDIWGIYFTNTKNAIKFDGAVKWRNITREIQKSIKYSTGWASITSVEKLSSSTFLDERCQFIYDITTESNTFECNNLWVHNCMAATLYPMMLEGTGNIDGVTPCAPNDIQSFSGQVTNLLFLLSSQVRGAVALGDYFVALNYYVIAEFGSDWYNRLDTVISTSICKNTRTVKDAVRKGMKQFIYGVSQPAGNRSYNSPFSNLNFFDSYYFNSMFKDFYYPDGTKPEWKAIDTLQRMFLKLHRELRLIKPLTFPVTTMCLLHDGNDVVDKDYKELCADELSKGSSFFIYLSDSSDSVASCCFAKDQKILWKSSVSGVHLTTFEELEKLPYTGNKENFKVFHNGSWVKGKLVKLPNRKMYEVTTSNNKKIVVTDNHLNPTLRGDIKTSELIPSDYLLFNQQPLQAIVENDEHLTYEQGFVIGSFLGDGSFGSEQKGVIYDINFSQNLEKHKRCMEILDVANQQVGGQNKCHLNPVYNNVYPVRISSKELAAFIIKWTNWKRGIYAFNKELNLNCLLQSIEFRKGILDGWYSTDGGNSNRCYTTSPKLAEDMEALITSLGLSSIVDISDRTDEAVVIRGEVYNRNYPLYCVRWYEPANHRKNKDIGNSWIKKNNSIYFKIKNIQEVDYSDNVYCFECSDEEPYFTLPNGIITHNCRVRNEITDNTFSSTTGLTGIMTGSSNVITLNFNRIVQDWFKTQTCDKQSIDWTNENDPYRQSLCNYIVNILERVYKYQIAFKSLVYDMEDKGMYSSSNAGYIYSKKLYSTIGFLGYCEAAEFMGLQVNYNKAYVSFIKTLLKTIEDQNKIHSIHDKKRPCVFNSEGIPKSLGI